MRIYHIFKRTIDILVSLIIILILSPLLLLLSIWVKISSKGPIIYKHIRIGKNGRHFEVYKFRSMIVGARDLQKRGVPDERLITSAGSFMRKTFLDELPQLFNVLKGDISLVGPRPLDKEAFERWVEKDKEWKNIVKTKPGMTSIESVADYLSSSERIKFEEHFKGLLGRDVYDDFEHHRYVLDSYYSINESFWLDVKIVVYTVILMLKQVFSV